MENENCKDLDQLTDAIGKLAEGMSSLVIQALQQYSPIVESIISSKSKNTNDIERTLDSMLDFCFDDRMLLMFNKLCRYYYTLNQPATITYVNSYREMWDNKKNQKTNKWKKLS